MTEWELHGLEFGNCNCAYACPCQFNALPTYGDCRAIGFFRVDKGHFGKTPLDGLKMAFAVSWPGPVHKGGGHMQPIIDAKGDPDQRRALLSIMTGRETDEMATFFAVYTAMCEKVHDPVYSEIRIDADMKATITLKFLNTGLFKSHDSFSVNPSGFKSESNVTGVRFQVKANLPPVTDRALK